MASPVELGICNVWVGPFGWAPYLDACLACRTARGLGAGEQAIIECTPCTFIIRRLNVDYAAILMPGGAQIGHVDLSTAR